MLSEKLTASRENRGELLGDEVMKTPSHRNFSLQVTLVEFEQLLQGRKGELVFTLQSHFVDFGHDLVCSLQYNTTEYQI